ncbi:hypothetical protein TIFTF001_014040 [Ficus carica]|uniref:Uncharacterized protein n=1 Tax=Ficus carica TaxID=3494 RepID=A0AA88DID5_FICCA|nr:hypothetical protein TIFTF001_014040 [Ficus carica]
MAAKFTTNYEQAIPPEMCWDDAHRRRVEGPMGCAVIFKNLKAVPQLLLKPSVVRSSSGTNSE